MLQLQEPSAEPGHQLPIRSLCKIPYQFSQGWRKLARAPEINLRLALFSFIGDEPAWTKKFGGTVLRIAGLPPERLQLTKRYNAPMPTYLALLKGINVGGRNLVKMADLKDMFLNLGFAEVSTVLQSGNVVFKSSSLLEAEAEALLQSAFSKRFGFEVDFIVRQSGQIKNAILKNPFSDEAKSNPSHLLIHFFRQPPNLENLDAVQSAIKGPERLQAIDSDVFVIYPDGIGTSTVTRTPGWNKLMGVSTARNWNTILKLAAQLD